MMTHNGWPLAIWGGWFALVAVMLLIYGVAAWRGRWAAWRVSVFVVGCLLTLASAWGLHNPLASMTSYTIALMSMGQIVSPLLLVGIPPTVRARWHAPPHTAWSELASARTSHHNDAPPLGTFVVFGNHDEGV